MRMIITGAEAGLGKSLANRAIAHRFEVYCIPGHVIRSGKEKIELEIDKAIKAMGSIDALINNFGTNHLSWIGETPEVDEEIMQVNVMGPYWTINALVARKQKCRAVNIASAAHRVPMRCSSLYCASKAALVHMTAVMARELAPQGWIINSVSPGMIPETRMAELTRKQVSELRGWNKEEADKYAHSLIPMGRYSSTREITDAVYGMLAMPDYVNGTNLDVMGGV